MTFHALIVGLAAALPLVNAEGCYTNGLAFKALHGHPDGAALAGLDLDAEVRADINTVCNIVSHTPFVRTGNTRPSFKHCSNWTVTVGHNDESCKSCLDFWGGVGCDDLCVSQEIDSVNRIEWEIIYWKLEPEITLPLETCRNNFTTELGCHAGSMQFHGDWWFKIDPNEGPCP